MLTQESALVQILLEIVLPTIHLESPAAQQVLFFLLTSPSLFPPAKICVREVVFPSIRLESPAHNLFLLRASFCCVAFFSLFELNGVQRLQVWPRDCNILQHTATHCDTLQHTATHCNTLQHTAAHCSTHCNSSIFIVLFYKETWHSIEPLNQTTRCNSLQHTTTHYKHCNTLQHSATHCRDCNKPQHTATHCNTLQHAAAHSNTLPSPHIVSTMDE